ncbi:hypothetical protein ONZ45_g17390 [Pleurotus djamor]|nr:hypothetical protein ONZ45_g17390 [Pleurotus djamor]
MSINELPVETLLNIIRAAVIIPLADGGCIDCERAARLASVCKHWRTIITGTPDLWKEINSSLTTPALTTIFERFNPTGPISIRPLPNRLPIPIHNFRLMARESHRLREVNFLLYEDDWKTSSKRLCLEAPLLESFALSLDELYSDSDDDARNRPSMAPCSLPCGIFGGVKPPCLRYLSLSQVKVSWSSPILHNLTALSLDFQDRPSLDEFVSALRHMPLLESLELLDCLPLNLFLKSRYFIPLPKLRALRLNDFAPPCDWFLSAVDMSPECVEVRGLSDLRMCVGLFRASAAYLARVGREYLGLDIKVGPVGGIPTDKGGLRDGFDITLKVVTQASRDDRPLSALDIQLSIACPVSEFEDALSTIVKAIHKPLRNIRFLTLNVTPVVALSNAFWLDVFDACFPKLGLLGLRTAEDLSAFFSLSLTKMVEGLGRDASREDLENWIPKIVPFKNVRNLAGLTFKVDNLVSTALSLRSAAGYPLYVNRTIECLLDIHVPEDST